MALSEALEELLKLIPDEKDREAQRQQLEKYEVLRSGYLRQADYDRNMNNWKKEKTALEQEREKALGIAREWETWGKTNKPRHDQLLTEHEALIKERDELMQKVQEATARASLGLENDMDAQTVLKAVQDEIGKRGYVSRQDIDTIIAQKAAELAKDEVAKTLEAERKVFFEQTFPQATRFQLDLNSVQFKHQRGFNEDLNVDEFLQYMKDKKLTNVNEAYESFMAPKKMELEIKQRVAAEVEKLKKESPTGVPGTLAPPAPELGPVQLFKMKKYEAQIPENAEAGDGSLAHAAAAELRAEGKY
jgi:hypothetical protein